MLCGLGGNDVLLGKGGNDVLIGGPGLDVASYAGAGTAITANLGTGVATGQGTDTLEDMERVTGGLKADRLTGNAAANTLTGGAGSDTLNGGGGADSLVGGDGNDALNGGEGNDSLNAGPGTDVLNGAAGNDTLNGGPAPTTAIRALAPDRRRAAKPSRATGQALEGPVGPSLLFGRPCSRLGDDGESSLTMTKAVGLDLLVLQVLVDGEEVLDLCQERGTQVVEVREM